MAIIQCPKCGAMVSDTATFCPKCGAPIAQSAPPPQQPQQQQYQQQQQPSYDPYPPVQPEDAPNIGLNILSVFFPIVGWVLYFVYRDKEPLKAKSCSKFAWIGFGIGMAINILGAIMA